MLPKTKTAKSAAITVEALHAACDLTAAAHGALSVHQESPLLGKVSQQLDMITAHLAIPNVPSSEWKLSYAAAATALTSNTHSSPTPASTPRVTSTANSSVHPHFRPCPLPTKCFDITLSQKTQDSPTLANLSNDDLICRVLQALKESDYWLGDRP